MGRNEPGFDRASSSDVEDGLVEDVAAVLDIGRREDVAAICGRLDSAPTFSVVLHAPRGNASLATEYGIRRLQRHAEEGGYSVALATRNRALAARALTAGFPVARTPLDVRWDRPGRTLVSAGPISLALPALGPLPGILAITVGLGAIIGGVLFAAPSATVVITLSGEPLSHEADLTIVKSAASGDTTPGVLASRAVSIQDTVVLAVPATGSAEVAVVPATVVVALTAPGGGAEIPAGAVVVGDTVRFRIDQAVTLGPGEVRSVTATAVVAGPGSNVAAGVVSAWEDATLGAVKVTNPTAAAGGANAVRAVVTEADLKLAQARAIALTASPAMRDRLVRARPGELVLAESVTIEAEPGDALTAAGTPADLALLEVKLTLRGDAVPAAALASFADLVFGSPKRRVLPGSVAARQLGAAMIGESGTFLRVELTATGVPPISQGEVRDLVKGRRPGAAKGIVVSRYRMDDVEVRVSPGWAPFVPWFGDRIDLEIRGSANESASAAPRP